MNPISASTTRLVFFCFFGVSVFSPGLGADQPRPSQAFERIWTGEEVDMRTGDISADGRVMSDINWDSGDIDLIDIETSRRTGLTGKGYDAGRYGWTSVLSNDGNRIAVSWFLFEAGRHELRIHALGHPESNVIVPAGESHYAVEPLDWSPDDEKILVALQFFNGTWELGLVSVSDGRYRTLKKLGWFAPGGEQGYPRAFFSPDGAQVGFDYPIAADGSERAIHLLAVNGDREDTLLGEGAANRFLGWTRSGNEILVYSDREGRHGIWALRRHNGAYETSPTLLVPVERGLVPFRRTDRGFAFGVTESTTRVHVAEVDSNEGRLLSHPKPVQPVDSLSSEGADFSPDGTRLAYLAHDPYPQKTQRLVVIDLASGAERSVPVRGDIYTSRATFRWVNDRSIVLFGAEKGRPGIFSLDPVSGQVQRLPAKALSALPDFKWFEVDPEGEWLFTVLRNDGGVGGLIAAIEVETGRQVPIERANTDRRSLAVSPDGRSLAYLARADGGTFQLRVVPASGEGTSRLVHEAAAGERLDSPVAWAADGGSLFYVHHSATAGRELRSVSVAGGSGAVQTYGRGWCCVGHDLNVHPDGKRLVFLSGTNRTSVVVLSGF